MTTISGRQHTIEHVDTASHGLDDILRRSNPHQITRGIRGQAVAEKVEHAPAVRGRFTHRQTAYRIAVEADLEQTGEPLDPTDLREHRCLHYGYLGSGSQWRLAGGGHAQTYAIHCVMWSNNGEILKNAAIADQGIALLPTFIVGEALQAGQLRTVLTDYKPPDIALSALYPRHRHLSAKVRLFVELLEERFGYRPYWDLVQ